MSTPSELLDLIANRRTIKPTAYRDETIPRKTIEALLDAANWAPSHGKTEPWRFHVFTSEGLERLHEILTTLYETATPPEDVRSEKLDKYRANTARTSHAIAVFMERHEGKIPEIEEIEAVACAVQNLQLAATAHGLGAFWSTGPMTYHEAANRLYDVPAHWSYLGVIFLGVPADSPPPGKRGSVEDKTTWIES